MRKSLNELFRKSAAVVVLSGGVMAFMLAAAGQAPAADLSSGDVVYDDNQPNFVCGQDMSKIVLFDAEGRPTIPARTEMFACITGVTLISGDIPPPPEYCCH
ncbi:MAG: hypothetical protein ACTSSQ_04175 [Alphaproteobacteria bacterium]